MTPVSDLPQVIVQNIPAASSGLSQPWATVFAGGLAVLAACIAYLGIRHQVKNSKKQFLKQVRVENDRAREQREADDKRARDQRIADDDRAREQRIADDDRAREQREADEEREFRRHRREMTVQILAEACTVVSRYGEHAAFLQHADKIADREMLLLSQWITDIDVASTKLHMLGLEDAVHHLGRLSSHFRRHWNEYVNIGESTIDVNFGTMLGADTLEALRRTYSSL